MPRNDNIKKWDYPGELFLNEEPMTKFVDEIDGLKVSLISSPQKEELYRLFKNVAYVSWNEVWNDNMSYEESVEFLQRVLNDGMLPLALEMNNFTFLFENLSRLTTHAVVRGRVGMTYAQMSTGNADQRHSNILMPRSFSTQNRKLLDNYLQWAIKSKMEYANAVDNNMSVQEARIFLPITNTNKMYVSMNLASLKNFFGKRSDRTEEYMQGNEICRQIKEIFNKKYPELSPYLQSACGKYCAHTKDSPLVNGVYIPCPEDDKFEWNIESFLYKNTRDEMCWNENIIEDIYFKGNKEISKSQYESDII